MYLLTLILMLTTYWLLSFFGQSIVGVSHTSGFIDVLSVIIVVLIIVRFLS
jgi:hypothetical protein